MTRRELSVIQGTLEMVVLTALAGGEHLHGFGILDWVREHGGEVLQVEEAALYPALHRMEKRGWLTSEWGVSEKGRRAKYYALTGEGRAALAQRRSEWTGYVDLVDRLARAAGL